MLSVDERCGYVVLHPDCLLSCTTVAKGFSCDRKAVVGQRFSTSSTNVACLRGTMLHDLFEHAVLGWASGSEKPFSPKALAQGIELVLGQHTEGLYAVDMSEREMRVEMRKYVRNIQRFGAMFLRETPKHRVDEPRETTLCLPGVTMTEENIWSPTYGLKGKVDVSVTARYVADGTGRGGAGARAPMELKTGKPYIDHRTQVLLYTLMMREQHGAGRTKQKQKQSLTTHTASMAYVIIMRHAHIIVLYRTRTHEYDCNAPPPPNEPLGTRWRWRWGCCYTSARTRPSSRLWKRDTTRSSS